MSIKVNTGVFSVNVDGQMKNIGLMVGDTEESLKAINAAGTEALEDIEEKKNAALEVLPGAEEITGMRDIVTVNKTPTGNTKLNVKVDGNEIEVPDMQEFNAVSQKIANIESGAKGTITGELKAENSRLSESIDEISDDVKELDNAVSVVEDAVLYETNTGGFMQANGTRFVPSGAWTNRTYKVTFRNIIVSATYNHFAPLIVFFNGVPSEDTVIGYYNPDDTQGTTVLQAIDEKIVVPNGATYFVVNTNNTTTKYEVKTLNRAKLSERVSDLETRSDKNDEKVSNLIDVTSTFEKETLSLSYGFFNQKTTAVIEPTSNGSYYCTKIKVNEGEKYTISGYVIAKAYSVTALLVFIDENNTTIIGSDGIEQTEEQHFVDYEFIVPEGCGYIGITSYRGKAQQYSAPTLKKQVNNKNVLDASKKYKVTVESEHITVETKTGNVYKWKPMLANYLYQLYSWVIDGKTYQHNTDMVGPFMNLVAVNNGDGNRSTSPSYTNASFTGGCHGFNGNQTGTPTAKVISKHIIIDGVEQSANGVYFCDSLSLRFIDGIQAHNTCKEDGTGRTVLNEEVTYTFDDDRIKVSVFLAPLEDVKVQRYYGLQLAGYKKYYMLADKYYEIGNTGRKQVKPTIIVGYDDNSQVSFKMYETGLGDYHYNQTQDKAISSSDKAYFYPIEVSGGQLWSQGETWYWIGEYVFGKVFDFA